MCSSVILIQFNVNMLFITPLFSSYPFIILSVALRVNSVYYCMKVVYNTADDHRMLLEPACAAAVSAIYSGMLQRLQNEGRLSAQLNSGILLIVCGGIGVTADMLNSWKTQFGVG